MFASDTPLWLCLISVCVCVMLRFCHFCIIYIYMYIYTYLLYWFHSVRSSIQKEIQDRNSRSKSYRWFGFCRSLITDLQFLDSAGDIFGQNATNLLSVNTLRFQTSWIILQCALVIKTKQYTQPIMANMMDLFLWYEWHPLLTGTGIYWFCCFNPWHARSFSSVWHTWQVTFGLQSVLMVGIK